MPNQKWDFEVHREEIYEHYIRQNHSLKDVMTHFEFRYQFKPRLLVHTLDRVVLKG